MTYATVRSVGSTPRTGVSQPFAQDMSNAECALALLERSIAFGHGRLAVLRLAVAVDIGAAVPLHNWAFCARVAKDSADPDLQAIYRSAVAKVAEIEHADPRFD
jgi:hypothetical protein